MTALVGVFGHAAATAPRALPAMLEAMAGRASGVVERYEEPGVLLAARQHPWETGIGGWSGPLIAWDDSWVVAADASIYYLRDLQRQLARYDALPEDLGTGDLLLRALRWWREDVGRRLEGDYAFIAWDRVRRVVVLSREFGGRRTLSYAVTADGSLIVATSPRAVVQHPSVSRAPDRVSVAAAAAGIDCSARRTAFESVRSVRAGATEVHDRGRIVARLLWEPPAFSDAWEDSMSDTAAEELRALLQASTRERLSPAGSAAIWMSGGWDSTSVYAAARSGGVTVEHFPIISLAYPEGDAGDERAFVNVLAEQWNAGVAWVGIDAFGLFQDGERRVRMRDDLLAHPFESVLRGLSDATVGVGQRVAIDGAGGDNLLLASTGAVLGQHFASGRWLRLLDAWRAHALTPRAFIRLCVLPNLARETVAWLGAVRGRPLADYGTFPTPPWVHDVPLRTARAEHLYQEPGEGPALFEARTLLTAARLSRVMSQVHAFGLDQGVAIRSPFLDRRLVEFVARRPLSDRGAGSDSKRLLRKAMAGLIPATVLAARRTKTGTPIDYFRRQMEGGLNSELWARFGASTSALETSGVIDGRILRQSLEDYGRTSNHLLGSALQCTLETERWFAAHLGR